MSMNTNTRSPKSDSDTGLCQDTINNLLKDLRELGMKWNDLHTHRPRPYSRLMALHYWYDSMSVSDYCKGGGEQEVRDYLKGLGICGEHITIYRGTVHGSIEPGDWVALERGIAEWYADEEARGPRAHIVSVVVSSKDVRWAGTDVTEWFYLPAELEGCVGDKALEEIKKEFT